MSWIYLLYGMVVICAVALLLAFTIVVPSFSREEPTHRAMEYSQQIVTTKRTADIVITLTTLPHRVNEVLPMMLHSVRMQTVQPKSVEINLPKQDKEGHIFEVPVWLQKEVDCGHVRVYRVEDQGPATKYLSTLKRYEHMPDQLILVVDDDMLLHPKRVEDFEKAAQRYPNDALCAHGMIIDNGKMNYISAVQPYPDYKTTVFPKIRVTKEEPIDIVTGTYNFTVKPRFVNWSVLQDYEHMPKEAFWVDDVVISGHLAQQGIIRRVPKDISGPNYIPQTHFWKHVWEFMQPARDNKVGLSTGPNRSDDNNNIMIEYYKDYW